MEPHPWGHRHTHDTWTSFRFPGLGSKGASKGWLCGALKHSPEASSAQAPCVRWNSWRVRHHDRRVHHLHQCRNLYSQLSTDQPSSYFWPSKPARLLKLSASYWNVRDGLQTAIFLIINLHPLTCLFSNPVRSFCKLLEQEKTNKQTNKPMLELRRLFLLFKWGIHLKSKEHCEFVKWLLFAQRPRHCKVLVFAKGQPNFL